MSQSRIRLKLHRKQEYAYKSEATEILYGGAAGGGKSFLMRCAAILWCMLIPGLNVYLFRRMSNDLDKNHMEGPKGFRALLAPWVSAGLVEIVEGEIRFLATGSKIFLCHCKDEKDRFKYQGAEIHVLLIDELTHFTKVIYEFLRSRVRMSGLKVPAHLKDQFPRILCGSNPGGIGHTWVKEMFIDGCSPFDIRQMPEEEGGMLRQFIPALLSDNPSMEKDDPKYKSRIMGMGKKLSRMFLLGDWTVIDGAYFDEFCSDHIVRPFSIPKHWTRFQSYDHGSAKPFSCGWWAVSDGTIPRFPRGSLIRYREWYGSEGPNKGLKLPTKKIAQGILAREAQDEEISWRAADPAIFAEDGGKSTAKEFKHYGVNFKPADNSRITGWQRVRDLLAIDEEDKKPRFFVFDTCHDFIRLFPAAQHDDRQPEDLDTDGEDHIHDETRYGVNSSPYPTDKEPEPRGRRTVEDLTMDEIWEYGSEEKGGRV